MAEHHDPKRARLWVYWTKRVLRFLGRWLRRLAKTVVALLVTLLVALFLVQLTPPGRDLVLETALSRINEMIPGTIEARELDRLSLLGVELHGIRVLDPAGETVLTLEHASLDTDLSELFRGRLAAKKVLLSRADVDLRWNEEKRGLMAAFVDPDAPETPSKKAPPDIVVRGIELNEVRVHLPEVEPVGQLTVLLSVARADYALLEGESVAHLEELELVAQREQKQVLALRMKGALDRGLDPSHLDLHAESFGMQLDLKARGVLPLQESWETEPLRASLKVQHVTADRLQRLLRMDQLEDAFLGEIDLQLDVEGKPEKLVVDGAIRTRAGTIAIEQVRYHDESAELRVSTKGLKLHELKTDLPERTVSADLALETQGLPPGPVRVDVALRKAVLDGEPLPDVDASGRLTPEGLDDLSVEARSGDSRLTAKGRVEFEGEVRGSVHFDAKPQLVERVGNLFDVEARGHVTGDAEAVLQPSGRLQAQGRLELNRASLDENKVEEGVVRFDVQGTPPDLGGSVELDARHAQLGPAYVDRLNASAEGDLQDFDVSLKGSGGQAPPPAGERPPAQTTELEFQGRVQMAEDSATVSGRGKGRFQGQDVELEVAETRIGSGGGVETEGVTVDLGGQQIKLRGAFGQPGGAQFEDLEIDAKDVSVQRIAGLLGYDEPRLEGTADVRGRLSGSADVPVARLSIAVRKVGFRDEPRADVQADIQLDAAEGKFDVDLRLKGEQIDLGVRSKGEFAGGPGFAKRLTKAEGKLRVDLDRLDSELLTAYLPDLSLPASGRARARWEVTGSVADPTIDAVTEVLVDRPGKPRSVKLVHALDYGKGKLETGLDVVDAEGTWAEARVQIDFPGEPPGMMELPPALPKALSEARWRVEAETAPRKLEAVPLIEEFVDGKDLPPFMTQMRLAAVHEPGEEPKVDLLLGLRQTGSFELGSCSGEGLWMKARLRHRGERNRLRVEGMLRGEKVLVLDARAEQALLPLVRGEVAKPGPVSLTLVTKELNLDEVPFVCEMARGRARLRAKGRDVLGADPSLEVAGRVRDFSLGHRETVDVELKVQANSDDLELGIGVQGKKRHSSSAAEISALVDWSWRGGAIELRETDQLRAEVLLSHLPVGPVLPAKGPISYPSGMLDGRIRAQGPLRAPEIDGELRLEDISFTITSLAQPLRDVNGRIVLKERMLSIEHLEAHDGDGVVELKGYVDVRDMKEIQSRFGLEADDFPVRQAGQVVAVTDLVAKAEVRVTPETTRARVDISKVDTWIENLDIRRGIELEPHPEFVIDGDVPELLERALENEERTPGIGVQEELDDDGKEEGRPILIYVEADDHFWVKRSDFAVKLSTRLKTEIRDETVRVNGDVKIDRGYLQLFGKVFELERDSELRFIGSSPPNPVLEIKAHNDTPSGTRVTVAIAGRADSPELTFMVDDAVVDASIAFRELISGRDRGSEQDATAQATSFVGGLTAGILATAARRELGSAAPIIMIDPGERAGQGRIRAGFELDRVVPEFLKPIITGVYLEGIVAREDAGEQAEADTDFGALLEFYFPKNFFAAGQYGPGTIWSIDFGWQL